MPFPFKIEALIVVFMITGRPADNAVLNNS